jgi:hypothetical protein
VVRVTWGASRAVAALFLCYAIVAALQRRSARSFATGGGTPLSDGPPFSLWRRCKGDAVAV